MIGKYGPVIKYEKDGKTIFKSVKKDLNISKLKKGEYTLKDVLDDSKKSGDGKILGKYKEKEVIVKTGRYGMYINYNGKNMSIKHIKKSLDEITLSDVKDILDGKVVKSSSIIRQLDGDTSIRNGKYGHYVYYKTNKMKKPKFIKIRGIKESDITVEWVKSKL